MKLIIDIPNHVKNRLIFGATYKDDLRIMVEALADGTPLPEHKGRLMLVDIDELPFFRCPNNVNKCPPSYDFTCQNCDYGITSRFRIERMGTLIESKEEKENE